MAFRDAVATNTIGTTSVVGNMPTKANGDSAYAMVTQDVDGVTFTPHADWALVLQNDQSVPDGQSRALFRLTGGVTGSTLSSYTWTSVNLAAAQVVIVTHSGRSLAETFVTNTTNTTNNTSPISASFAGGTALGADDLIVFMALDKVGTSDVWSFATPTGSPGTFTLRINKDDNGNTGVGLATIDNISSGATGSIADTITQSSGSSGAGWGGWVIALSAGGPTITVQPTSQTTREGTTATFNLTATGTGTLHYQWHANGGNVGTDSSSYTTSTLTIADNLTVIDCLVTDDNSSTASNTVYLLVYEVPPIAWISA